MKKDVLPAAYRIVAIDGKAAETIRADRGFSDTLFHADTTPTKQNTHTAIRALSSRIRCHGLISLHNDAASLRPIFEMPAIEQRDRVNQKRGTHFKQKNLLRAL